MPGTGKPVALQSVVNEHQATIAICDKQTASERTFRKCDLPYLRCHSEHANGPSAHQAFGGLGDLQKSTSNRTSFNFSWFRYGRNANAPIKRLTLNKCLCSDVSRQSPHDSCEHGLTAITATPSPQTSQTPLTILDLIRYKLISP